MFVDAVIRQARAAALRVLAQGPQAEEIAPAPARTTLLRPDHDVLAALVEAERLHDRAPTPATANRLERAQAAVARAERRRAATSSGRRAARRAQAQQ